MKNKLILILSLIFVFNLVACNNTEEQIEEENLIVCDEGQTLINGVCVGETQEEETVYLLGEWLGFGFGVEQTENLATMSYENIPSEWWVINAQLPLDSFDVTRASIIFTFTGVEDHSYLFKIEGENYDKELAILGTGDKQTLELDLSGLTEVQRAELDLIVLFVRTTGAAGDIIIHSVQYGRVVESSDDADLIPSLVTPFGVLIQYETEIAWGAIPEATSFNVYVDGVEGSPFKVEAGFFAFNLDYLDLPAGFYVIQIRAIGDGINFVDSKLSHPILHLVDWDPGEPGQGSSNAEVLPTPFGVVFHGDEIMWGAIPEATSFNVYIDGVEGSPFNVPAGFYALNLENLSLSPGFYIIQIRAIGDGENFVDSVLTVPVIYVQE